jgi:hypothetical protein
MYTNSTGTIPDADIPRIRRPRIIVLETKTWNDAVAQKHATLSGPFFTLAWLFFWPLIIL